MSWCTDGVSTEFYKNFRKNLGPVLFKCLNEIKSDRVFPKSFLDVSITLIPESEKESTRKESYLMKMNAEILNKIRS